MEMTIPFAIGWGAVLTAITAGVAIYDKKKESQKPAELDEKVEAPK